METFIERNYKKEYQNYHSKPEQKKRRAGRNHARRQLKDTKGIVGKDVHHKDGNPLNNDKSNLSIVTQKYNRTEPRLREEDNPRIPRKKGQPANSKKHSDLYTDENPKGTIHGLKFATVADAEASVKKIENSGKSHAHKIQAAVAMEQRAREMGKTSEAAVYRTYINKMKKKTKDEEREPQDKDIKDKEGTQPAKYFKGLKKTTKSKRDAHFKKGAKKSDSDSSAYKDAPGDKKARKEPMRKSKYTKDYQKMYGEVLAYEARAFHDFGANSPSANNKIRDIANKAKDYKDAMNKIVMFARGTSTPSKKFAQAIGSGKFTDYEPDKDIAQNVKDFIQQRDRVKKLGPRANDPDANLQVQIKGAEDLRTGSNIKLDDGSTVKVTQKNAKIINMALDRVKPQMRIQLLKLLGKNKMSFNKTVGAIKRSLS